MVHRGWDSGGCPGREAFLQPQGVKECRASLPHLLDDSYLPPLWREGWQGLQVAAALLLCLHLGTALFCRKQGLLTTPAQSLRQRQGQAAQGWAGTESAAAGPSCGARASVWRGHAWTLHDGAGRWRRPERLTPAEHMETAPATSWPAEPGVPADLHIKFAHVGMGVN